MNTNEYLADALLTRLSLEATPACYFLGQAFLMELPERIPSGVELFVVTLLASLAIALLTIYYRSSRAATTNPADSLRYE